MFFCIKNCLFVFFDKKQSIDQPCLAEGSQVTRGISAVNAALRKEFAASKREMIVRYI